MSRRQRRARPSWLAPDGGMLRPDVWLYAAVILSVLLVEVWQTSRMAQLCLVIDQNRSATVQAGARLEYMRAALERRTTRAELSPMANELGLAPVDGQHVVMLPSEYLADGRVTRRDDGSVSLLALAERVSSALVPEATARSRSGN